MQINIKENQIIVEFSQRESNFITQALGDAGSEKISAYIKDKLIKAFSLQDLEKEAELAVGKDFNLTKIKEVTDELKKRTAKDKALVNTEINTDISASIRPQENEQGKEAIKDIDNETDKEADNEIAAQIGDELLADLLDKDLLKGSKKPKKGTES